MNKNLHKTIINCNTGLIVVVAENKMAVFSLSGSLNNNFNADKVQQEIDLQVKVTQEFRSNVQHFQAEQNKRKDELKAKLEQGEISQADYDAQVSRIQKQSLLVNMIAGGLMAPSDGVLGIATSTVSPAVSYAVGQHFKKEGKEGSFEHIATHAVIGALTSAANDGNALSGAVSAGGAEALAPIVAKVLYGKDNSQNLTADEKETVVSVTTAISTITGGAIGDSSANAYIGNTVAGNAVENNYLFPPEHAELKRLKQRRNEIIETKMVLDENGNLVFDTMTEKDEAELSEINKKIAYYEKLDADRDREYKNYEISCLKTADRSICTTYHQLFVVQRKKWTDIGIVEYKKDLDPVTGKPNSNWIEQPDYANKLHNYDPTGKKIMEKENGKYPNTKYVHKNGQYEVVLDQNGNIIEDFTNAGTFNYYAPSINPVQFILHKRFDMDGYFVFGNGGNDKTTFKVRDTWYSNNHRYTSPFSYITDKQRDKAIKVFNEINDEWLKSQKR